MDRVVNTHRRLGATGPVRNRVWRVLALLFPGQGSQRPQMGVSWTGHPAWEIVDSLSDAAGRDLGEMLTATDADTLRATRNAQLATFGLSLVILEAARAAGLKDAAESAVAGHSLGEYTALVASGALTPTEGARLVTARGEAMQAAADAQPGTMAAVLGLDADLIAQACRTVDGAWPANDNAPGQVVIAGTAAGVEAAGEAAKQLGAKRVMPLPVGGAFHSPLMAPARAPLEEALAATDLVAVSVDVVANVDAAPHRDGWAGLLSAQLVSPVRWRESLLALASLGVTHFLELGPGTELSGMVKRTVPGAGRANVATPDDLASLGAFFDGAGS
jgi:[acyl-carrier-protein] S-malonyltransferase